MGNVGGAPERPRAPLMQLSSEGIPFEDVEMPEEEEKEEEEETWWCTLTQVRGLFYFGLGVIGVVGIIVLMGVEGSSGYSKRLRD